MLAALAGIAGGCATTPALHNAIVGRVDQQGRRIADAVVIVTSPVLSGERTAITDENGHYVVGDLPTGLYTVTIYYPDVTVAREAIRVDSRAPTHLDVSLPPPSKDPITVILKED